MHGQKVMTLRTNQQGGNFRACSQNKSIIFNTDETQYEDKLKSCVHSTGYHATSLYFKAIS